MDLKEHARQVLSTWLFTLVLLAAGFGLYSYLYVEEQKQYFNEKKLRELRLLGDRLKLRIENIANNVFPNAVTAVDPQASPCKANEPDRSLRVYEILGASTTPSEGRDLDATCRFHAIMSKTKLVPNFTLEKFVEYRRFVPSAAGKIRPAVAPSSRVEVWPDGDTYTLLFTYESSVNQGDKYAQKWRGRIAVQHLLGQYGTESFDQLVVTDQRGDVQFQIGVTSVAPTNLASLVDRAARSERSAKPGESGEAASSSAWASVKDSTSVGTIKLAGEDYLLFLQPVRISLTGSDTANQLGTRTILDWRIAGLIRKDRFARDSSAFSYTVILIFLFLLLLTVFAGPFIKVASLGPLDRLRERDVVLLFISAALTAALITFFVADIYVYGQLERGVDSQLEKLAEKIQRNVDKDLKSLLSVLRDLSEKQVPPPGSTEVLNLLGKTNEESGNESVCKDRGAGIYINMDRDKGPDPVSLRKAFLDGAFFDRVVWVDPCGAQRRKWTIYDTNTPLIQVGERPYFQRVRDAQLWKKRVDEKDVCFWFGPIESWNTGESLATLSVRGPSATGETLPPDASCSVHADQPSRWVITLDAVLPSLRNVVLPPGYGFVVIENDGSVLFHSDPARHLRENFFKESDQEPALRAAVFGRATDFLNADYLGSDHRLRVKPFDAPPWTLVVFYDKHFLRTTNLEILSGSLIVFLLMLALLLPTLAVLWFRDPRWLWLDEKRRASYPPYLLGMLALVVLFLGAIFGLAPVSAAHAAFLITSVTLPVTYYKFRLAPSRTNPNASTWNLILVFGPPVIIVLSLFYGSWVEQQLLKTILLTIGVALIVIFVFLPSVQEHLKKARVIRTFPPTQTSYLLTIAGLLIVSGVLPALAFFRIEYESEMVLLLKHGQFRLAKSLDARKQRLRTETLKVPGGEDLFNNRTEAGQPPDVYQDFFFPCPRPTPSGRTQLATIGPLESVLKEIRLRMLFDPVAIESQGLMHNSSADEATNWTRDEANCLLLESDSTAPPGVRPVAVQVPTWWKPTSLKWFVGLVFLAVGHLSVIALMTTFIAKRIFLIGLENPAVIAEPPDPESFDNVWDRCCRAEKLALYDFAADGFLNYRNPATRPLLERGLFCLFPLRLANEAFRKPILEKGAADKDLLPGKEEKPSAWQKMKWPLLAALLGLATFLFFSQRKIFEGGVGLLSALAVAVTAFFNLFDQVRGTRR